MEEYDELARGWRQLVLKKNSAGPAIGRPSKAGLQLFLMACYDIDRFRAFVTSEGFHELSDIPPPEMAEALADDTSLMLFAFRQALFKAESREREAAERRQAQQDELYQEPDLP